jgi:hypothetical protein
VRPVTEQSEHLSDAQIENYGNRTSGAGPEARQGDDRQRSAEEHLSDRRSDDKNAADRSMVDQPSNDELTDGRLTHDQRGNTQLSDDQRVEAHLADCASCRNRVLDFHRSHFSLLAQPARANSAFPSPRLADSSLADSSLSDSMFAGSRLADVKPTDSALADSKFANPKSPADAQVRTAPTQECPSDDALRQLAAGLTSDTTAIGDALATKLLQHAATCSHCGPLLQSYTELFSDDFTPEEQATLNNLQSASIAWQINTARQMLQARGVQEPAAPATNGQPALQKSSAKATTERKPFFWKWVLVPAIAAVIALAAFGVWYTQRDTPEKVEKLLAQTYTNQRTTEMRWPGTPWGEPKETLGPAILNQPRTLLAAKSAIQKQTPETLKKAEWLHLKAQSEILSGMPSKQLIDDLTKATESDPGSHSLLFDLAIANFRMGEVTGHDNYYLQAKTVLDKILAFFPPSSAALFDRAIAEERLQLREQAIADLTRCLTLESDPAWSGEIQEKIKNLKGLADR